MMTRTAPDSVKKRDGSIVPFDASKIEHAIQRAAFDVLGRQERADDIARRVKALVVDGLAPRTRARSPGWRRFRTPSRPP